MVSRINFFGRIIVSYYECFLLERVESLFFMSFRMYAGKDSIMFRAGRSSGRSVGVSFIISGFSAVAGVSFKVS